MALQSLALLVYKAHLGFILAWAGTKNKCISCSVYLSLILFAEGGDVTVICEVGASYAAKVLR